MCVHLEAVLESELKNDYVYQDMWITNTHIKLDP